MPETWCLLIDWIGNDYTHTIIDTAIDFCHSREISLVVVAIGHLSFSLDTEEFDQYVLPLTANPQISRILISSAQISSHGGLPILERHIRKIPAKPIVCMGGRLGNFPVVKTRFQNAFAQLLEHLRAVHGYRRFAWVGGPADNPESREREQAFRDFLASHDLPMNPRLILEGNFTYASGKAAGAALISLRGEWDVVVSANDTMAVALRETLGPTAPLTGFDDSPAAHEHGFTSVNPNLPALVEKALEVLALASPDPTEPLAYVIDAAGLVIRSSCGCPVSAGAGTGRPAQDQSTERIGGMARNILICQDMEDLDRYLNTYLPTEGINYWKLLPTWKSPEPLPLLPQNTADSAPSIAIVHALCFNTELFGYLLLDLKNRDFMLSEWMRVHVSLLLQSWLRKSEGIQARKMLSLEIEKLERRKADIESVVNSLPVWIMEMDRRFYLRYINRAGSALIGLSPQEARNRPFLDFICPTDREALEQDLFRCRDHHARTSCQFSLIDAKGNKVPVACEAEPLKEERNVNLSTLFGSLSFEGGLRLTGLKTRPLVESRPLDDTFFRDFSFSKRQKEVLELLAKGMDVSETAQKMNLSDVTIRVQIHNIYVKTGVATRRELLELLNDYQVKSFLRFV